MNYSKPEMQVIGRALEAVQLQTVSNKVGSFSDRADLVQQTGITTSQESTASAYEADE